MVGLRSGGQPLVQFGGVFVLLTGLTTLLPAPWTAPAAETAPSRTVAGQLGGSAVAESAILLVAAAVAWMLLVWLVVAAGIALLTRIPGIAGASAWWLLHLMTPRVMRTALLTVVGASMVTGIAACGTGQAAASSTPASSGAIPGRDAVEGSALRPGQISGAGSAATAILHASSSRSRADQVDLDWPDRNAARPSSPHPTPGGPVNLDWPTEKSPERSSGRLPTPARAGPVAAPTTPTAATPVVVLRGDCLWSIAARHLPPGTGPAAVERAWRQWYSANSSIIGPDPNLVLPGQILLPPNSGTGA